MSESLRLCRRLENQTERVHDKRLFTTLYSERPTSKWLSVVFAAAATTDGVERPADGRHLVRHIVSVVRKRHPEFAVSEYYRKSLSSTILISHGLHVDMQNFA
jgi:hypothetical protein